MNVEMIRANPKTALPLRFITEEDTLGVNHVDGLGDFEYVKDPAKARSIFQEYEPQLRTIRDQIMQDVASISYPEGFQIGKEVRTCAQKAIMIIHQHKLADLQAIRGASGFAGVTNTKYVDGRRPCTLSTCRWETEFFNTTQLPDWYVKHRPVPAPGDLRNKFVDVLIGGVGIRARTAQKLQIAQEQTLSFTLKHALRLELVTTWGHEYAHAMVKGLELQGIDTERRAIESGYIRGAKHFIKEHLTHIHAEYFARAFGEAIQHRYLQDELGWSSDQTTEFQAIATRDSYKTGEAAYVLLDYLEEQGYTGLKLANMQLLIGNVAKEIYGEEEYSWYFQLVPSMIAYHTPPYSEGQLKELLFR